MFLGTYRHSVDAKGRVAIPARFREQLPSGTVISKGAEGCLQVYPPQEWGQEQGLRLGSATAAGEGRRPRGALGRRSAEAAPEEYRRTQDQVAERRRAPRT